MYVCGTTHPELMHCSDFPIQIMKMLSFSFTHWSCFLIFGINLYNNRFYFILIHTGTKAHNRTYTLTHIQSRRFTRESAILRYPPEAGKNIYICIIHTTNRNHLSFVQIHPTLYNILSSYSKNYFWPKGNKIEFNVNP